MKLLKLFIPGTSFVDASVYMGHLVATTTDRTMRFYELQNLAENLNQELGGEIPLASYIFARNDWLSEKPFRLLFADNSIKKSILSSIDKINTAIEKISTDFKFPYLETELPIDSVDILDIRCYNNRMYFATTDGLYHINVDWNEPAGEKRAYQRLDVPCLSLNAAYGSVNASCAENGLFSVLSDMDDGTNAHAKDLNQIAPKSIRTGWMSYNLVNYEDASDLQFYKGEVDHQRNRNNRWDKAIIKEFIKLKGIDKPKIKEFDEYNLSPKDIQFSFNTTNQIYYHTYSGKLAKWLNPTIEGVVTGRSAWRFSEGPGSRILSASPTRAGMVVETDDHIKIFNDDRWLDLVDGPVLSVRTYLTSKRFQNVISVVTEDGIWLITAWDPDFI